MAVLRCDECLEDYPVSRFPNLQAGQVCLGCMTGKSMKKVDEALAVKSKAMAKQLADVDPLALAPDTPKVKNILSSVYSEFGGPSGYASFLHSIVIKLAERDPVPSSLGAILVNIMKLQHSVEQTDTIVDAKRLTDEQLEREHDLQMMQLAMDAAGDPKKLKALRMMLQRQGLTISQAEPDETARDTANRLGVDVLDDDDVPVELMTDEELNHQIGNQS